MAVVKIQGICLWFIRSLILPKKQQQIQELLVEMADFPTTAKTANLVSPICLSPTQPPSFTLLFLCVSPPLNNARVRVSLLTFGTSHIQREVLFHCNGCKAPTGWTEFQNPFFSFLLFLVCAL